MFFIRVRIYERVLAAARIYIGEAFKGPLLGAGRAGGGARRAIKRRPRVKPEPPRANLMVARPNQHAGGIIAPRHRSRRATAALLNSFLIRATTMDARRRAALFNFLILSRLALLSRVLIHK